MNPCDVSLSATNPFATRYVRPGALAYVLPPGVTLTHLVEQLQHAAGWGQIVGPHGSGKTTLLHTLRPALERAGWRLQWYTVGAVRHVCQRWPMCGVDGRLARSWCWLTATNS